MREKYGLILYLSLNGQFSTILFHEIIALRLVECNPACVMLLIALTKSALSAVVSLCSELVSVRIYINSLIEIKGNFISVSYIQITSIPLAKFRYLARTLIPEYSQIWYIFV